MGSICVSVVKRVGNFMPGPESHSGTERPLMVRVHVFLGPRKAHKILNLNDPQLMASAMTNTDGECTIGVVPGEYTVVAEINGRLYLNSFDVDGRWSTIKVEEGQTVNHRIVDSSEAFF